MPVLRAADVDRVTHYSFTRFNLTNTIIKRDSNAWRYQVWISFGIAILMCAGGLLNLPGAGLDRAFMVMGYVFCLTATFGLSKYVRDRDEGKAETPMWGFVVWGGFGLAMGLTGWGLYRMNIEPVWQAYLLVSWMFLVSSIFTLAKMLRDRHEADQAEGIRRYERRETPSFAPAAE